MAVGARVGDTPAGGAAPGSPIGLRYLPLRAPVADEIRRRIIDGALQPGERLLEDQLAADLGVSRNPVREALQVLGREGFVTLEPRRGARARPCRGQCWREDRARSQDRPDAGPVLTAVRLLIGRPTRDSGGVRRFRSLPRCRTGTPRRRGRRSPRGRVPFRPRRGGLGAPGGQGS